MPTTRLKLRLLRLATPPPLLLNLSLPALVALFDIPFAGFGLAIACDSCVSPGNIPYSSIVNAFTGLLRQLLTETEAQLEKWREKLLTALGVNGQVIIDIIPELELIVGKQSAVPELGATESQNRFKLTLFCHFPGILNKRRKKENPER